MEEVSLVSFVSSPAFVNNLVYFIVFGLTAFVIVGYYGGFFYAKESEAASPKQALEVQHVAADSGEKATESVSLDSNDAKKPKKGKKKKMDEAKKHPLYMASLQGLQGYATCAAVDREGKHAVATDTKRRVVVYEIDSLSTDHPKLCTGFLEGDSATACDFCFDGAHVVVATESSKKLVFFKINFSTKKLTQIHEAGPVSGDSVRWMFAKEAKMVCTCSEEGDETEVKFWTYRGAAAASFDTRQVKNFHCAMSPGDGKFVGVAAWSSGVKVMEMKADKEHNIVKVEKAMDLRSSCGLSALAFSYDNTRAATANKKGMLAFWNVDVRYQVSEDPKVVKELETNDGDVVRRWAHLAITKDNKMLVAGTDSALVTFFSLPDLQIITSIHNTHEGFLRSLELSYGDKPFLVTCADDHVPKLWHLPPSE
eukprot:Platyproteum_vivax@DN391_c0_g1_i1.p1